jgi:3-oxoacyl-[acyl-carrier-protein] synthase II
VDGTIVKGSTTVAEVAITGMGLVTPLGCAPGEVLNRLLRGEKAFQPAPWGSSSACPVFAPVAGFDAARHFPENKTLRLMNRDAQMAVVAARLAMQDAAVVPGELYPAKDIALYGATGLSGLPPTEIASLLQNAAGADGSLDLKRFGQVALRRIRPVLSFKILANMPICFVSIFENLRGPNAVYTPWEGHGAQAIVAGIRAVSDGDVPCAVVGACDVKTHALSFLSLQQLGLFDSWKRHGSGSVPGEGAAFLVLEQREQAIRRGARVYASTEGYALRSIASQTSLSEILTEVLRGLETTRCAQVVSAGDGDPSYSEAELVSLETAGLGQCSLLHPKSHLGNLFAAAAPVQVALAALLAARHRGAPVLANCFGHGTEQAAFVLEAA